MALRATVTIMPPIPPKQAFTYPGLNFSKFGVCKWQYEQGDGPVHWINWQLSLFEPEYEDPLAFSYWVYPDLLASVVVNPYVPSALGNMVVNSTVVNYLTGEGFPVSALD